METFAALVNRRVLVPSQKTNYVAIEMNFLSTVLASRIGKIEVDESWYLERYPDIVGAIARGACASARDHYVMHGFYEHRLPHQITVDEDWYLDQHDDVRRAVSSREFASGQQHFDDIGFREGRLPYAGFSLVRADT